MASDKASVTQATPSPAVAPNHRKIWLPTVIVIVLIVAVAAVFAWQHRTTTHTSPTTKAGQPIISQNFTETTKFVLSGSVAGTGLSYNKPSEFGISTSGKLSGGADEVSTNSANQNVPLGEIRVLSATQPQPFTPLYIKNYGLVMISANTSPKNQQPLHDYVAQNMPAGYTVKVNSVSSFTSVNIKANAWKVSLTATPTKASDSATLPVQQGVLIVALGKQAYYRFMFLAADYNWNSSQPAIQKVINSLEVDQ